MRQIILNEGVFMFLPFLVWIGEINKCLIFLFITCNGELLNGYLKFLFQIPRPFWFVENIENIGKKWEYDYSFPSGHSQFSSCSVAALLILFENNKLSNPVFGLLLILFPVLTGICRVYLSVHSILCVLTGLTIGVVFSITVCSMFNIIFDWFESLPDAGMIIFTIFVMFAQ